MSASLGMYSATGNAPEVHDGRHLQGCLACSGIRRFFIAAHPDASPSQILLARQRAYARLEDAVADMGEGVVFDSSNAIVAFHERHLWLLERRSRGAFIGTGARA